MRYKIIFTPILVIIAFVIGFIVLMRGCLGKYDSYGVDGWPAVSTDSKTTAAITVENKTTSYTQRGGLTSVNYASTYFLSCYENATGNLLKRKELVELSEIKHKPVKAYGGYNNRLWIFADGLKAFDISTLEEVVNEDKLVALNPFMKNKFPRQQQFIQSLVPLGLINFTAVDGIKYQLHLGTLKIHPQQENDNRLAALSSFRLNPFFMDDASDFGTAADTVQGTMYALAASPKAILNSSALQRDNNNNERMQLYRLAYTAKSFGQHSIFSFADTVSLKGSSYLNGNFIKDTGKETAIRLDNPAGYLILHQDVIGDKAEVLITRIDTSNKKIWEVNTRLSRKIGYCQVSGNYLLLTGQLSIAEAPFIGNNGFCIINLLDGKLTAVNIK